MAFSFWSAARCRKKKSIGIRNPRGRGRFENLKSPVEDGQIGVGRDHVEAIRLDLHPIFCLDNGHLGVPREQFRHHALVGRLEVRHKHERQPGVRRQVGEELHKCLQRAGRAAHADDSELGRGFHERPPVQWA